MYIIPIFLLSLHQNHEGDGQYGQTTEANGFLKDADYI